MLAMSMVDDSTHYYENQYNQEHPANYGYHYDGRSTYPTSYTTYRS